MSLFRFNWLRRFVRKHSSPIPEENAALWKQRLSLGYMILAWNAFGIVCYAIYNGKADWLKYHGLVPEEELKMTSAQKWTRTLGIKQATVYSVSGTNVVRYEIENDIDELRRAKNKS